MQVFKLLNGFDSHALHFVYDRPSHMRAIIALDTIVDGRAVGGVRNRAYDSEQEAIEEACVLARTMSFKAALAGLPCGGAKTVIFQHPNMKRREAYRALGRAIEALGGLYHAGADLGTSRDDLKEMARSTRHVSADLEFGKHTAGGVLASMQAAVKVVTGNDSLRELTVAIQGLGEVGMELAQNLHGEGVRLVVSDVVGAHCKEAARRFGAKIAAPEDILFEPCDVLAPCAHGGVITPEVVPMLGCRIIVGSANNVLSESTVALDLEKAEVVFVPDFLSSAGALIVGVTQMVEGRKAHPDTQARIYDNTLRVLKTAKRQSIPPLHAAETLAARALKK